MRDIHNIEETLGRLRESTKNAVQLVPELEAKIPELDRKASESERALEEANERTRTANNETDKAVASYHKALELRGRQYDQLIWLNHFRQTGNPRKARSAR